MSVLSSRSFASGAEACAHYFSEEFLTEPDEVPDVHRVMRHADGRVVHIHHRGMLDWEAILYAPEDREVTAEDGGRFSVRWRMGGWWVVALWQDGSPILGSDLGPFRTPEAATEAAIG